MTEAKGSDVRAARYSPKLIARFWAKVKKTESGCWEWTASKHGGGYGRFYLKSKFGVAAHRFSYELMVGIIAPGLTLDHLCRNRSCVNPSHLEPVTMRVNTLRGMAPSAICAKKTHCSKGHPLSGDNVCSWKNMGGVRRCKICWRKYDREKHRKRAAFKRQLAALTQPAQKEKK